MPQTPYGCLPEPLYKKGSGYLMIFSRGEMVLGEPFSISSAIRLRVEIICMRRGELRKVY